MTPTFRQFSTEDFADLLEKFPFTRQINAIHLHHTWRPSAKDYKGLDTIVSMWRYHTEAKGWSDIAQHLTIAPDGTLWSGRNWNRPPCSANGNNGTDTFGPFMIEMIGDFDAGQDRFEGAQREATLDVMAHLLTRFQLAAGSIRFHNQMSGKTCPGSSLNHDKFLQDVTAWQSARARDFSSAPSGRSRGESPFGDEALFLNDALEALAPRGGTAGTGSDPGDAELLEKAEGDRYGTFVVRLKGRDVRRDDERGARLTPEMLQALRPHVVNLTQGRFSADGQFQSEAADVNAMFEEHLPRQIEKLSKDSGRQKLKIVFYAHGGLTSESDGLWIAYQHTAWWNANGVYPIHFVWETGFIETLKQLLSRSSRDLQRAAPRDLWDYTTDPALEAFCHTFGGVTIWSGMKRSAEQAVAVDGGAMYVATKLKEFVDRYGDAVELHGVGHSAGSIFHAHFVPAALKLGIPRFTTMQLLAPAIRVDAFIEHLVPHIGTGIDQLTMFTMNKDLEQADDCAKIYRKSLLYLIHYALEADRKTPILGLEASLRQHPVLKDLFGLAGTRGKNAEVIWSKTAAMNGRSATTSTTHGGFDNDAPTMNSVARRILNWPDTSRLAQEFPQEATRGLRDLWSRPMDWPEELIPFSGPPTRPVGMGNGAGRQVSAPSVTYPAATGSGGNGGATGRRRTVCVGIDRYPTAPLAGCVADARAWADTFTRLGFETPLLLLNEEATRQAILDTLSNLIRSSSPGDIVVFQYAGHGTELPDENGDEETGKDQALCPFDFAEGKYVIDDDVAEVFRNIPEGVNVTSFFDCCHSGTITRFAVGASTDAVVRNRRARFLPATADMKRAHLAFRRGLGRGRASASRGPEAMREVTFSACLSSEVAYENDGHGDFTVRATGILRAGMHGLTHEQFQKQVTTAFGSRPQQHPMLDCAPWAMDLPLLQPLTRTVPATTSADMNGKPAATVDSNGTMKLYEAIVPQLLKVVTALIDTKVK